MNLPSDAAQDQSGCPNDYYRRANGILHQIPTISNTEAQDSINLTRLDEMTREELIALVRHVCGARWGEIAMMTKEERLEAAKLKLWHGGLTEKEIYKALPALNAAMDRDIGKPAQSIAMTVENRGLKDIDTEKLLRMAAMMDEPILIAPIPK